MANWVVYLGVMVLLQVGSLALIQFGIAQDAKLDDWAYIARFSPRYWQRKFYRFVELFGYLIFMVACAIEVILVFTGLFFAVSQFLQ